MKEIDFDELDRAVNSLMSTVPSDKPADVATPAQPAPDSTDAPKDVSSTPVQPVSNDAQPEPTTPTVLDLDASPNMPESSSPQPAQPEEVETLNEAMQLVEETPAPTPAPAARRGRFMDVVRPSAVSKPAPSRPVSRQGVALQPSGVVEPQEAPVMPDLTSSQPDAMVDTESDTSTMVSPDTTPPTLEDAANMESVTSPTVDAEAPLSSPFLPDAKVEKRPLGRPVEPAPAVDLAAELATTTPETSASDTISPNKDAQLPEQPLPAELGSELLSIETAADTLPSGTPQPVAAPEVAPEAPITPDATATPAPQPARIVTGASIPQQYKVQPQQATNEAPSGAIYDAQPLVHGAEKKSNWIWKVVAIIAIALLGAGGGAAIYYLGLI